jgi:hypothetical protein
LGAEITFVADDALVMLNPLSRIYQLGDGTCITLTETGATTSSLTTKAIVYGPYTSCTQCITPLNSAGVTSINCDDCGTGTVTATTLPHAIYTNGQNRAISQNNTVTLGGPNGLNN